MKTDQQPAAPAAAAAPPRKRVRLKSDAPTYGKAGEVVELPVDTAHDLIAANMAERA